MENISTKENAKKKIDELWEELVRHGFGKIYIETKALKDGTMMVIIDFGKTHVFFIKKKIDFEDVL